MLRVRQTEIGETAIQRQLHSRFFLDIRIQFVYITPSKIHSNVGFISMVSICKQPLTIQLTSERPEEWPLRNIEEQ